MKETMEIVMELLHFQIDKLQQSDAERIAEAEEQPQPPPMMMGSLP
jgi:hypothetical protein